MAENEKHVDAVTGTETTGHEWDGIRELNTPLPRWWLYVFYATIAWSAVYCIFYPSWPSLSGYASGVLSYSSRENLVDRMDAVASERAVWTDQFAGQSIEEIAADPELLQFAMSGGKTIFADNCAPCHGSGGAGAPGYPVLADDEWIWGGTLNDIETTILYGVRNDHPDTRFAMMPAFGADEILERDQIEAVADYVLSLSGQGSASEEGATIFEEQCVACHGEDGTGIAELGAPNLTDSIWLYGGERQDIVSQIVQPQHGVMPPWDERLTDVEVKQAAIYVHSLGGGQ